MQTVRCNICGSDQSRLLYRNPDLLLDNNDELFTLVKCEQCGLIYQNPRLDQDEIEKYYPEDYEAYVKDRPKNKLLEKVSLRGIQKRCRIVNALSKPGTTNQLLDIGCSTGLFLSEMRKIEYWSVAGVELSEYAAQVAREKFHLEVFTGELHQAKYPDGKFNVITLWDVLEHLPDPSKTLDEIERITKPGGYLVLRIPNTDSLDAKIFRQAWAGFDQPRHFYAFSSANIKNLLRAHGYQVNKISGNIGTYPTFLLSIRFWLTLLKFNVNIRNKMMQFFEYPLIKLLVAPFFFFYGSFLLGTEMIVIAQKT